MLPSGIGCVYLSGVLDIPTVNEINLKFTVYTASHRKPVIIDMEKVTMISSTGIGMLIAACNALRAHKMPMILLKPQPAVEKMIAISGLQEILPVVHDLQIAINRISGLLQT